MTVFYFEMPWLKKRIVVGVAFLTALLIAERTIGNEWISVTRCVEGLIVLFTTGAWFRHTYKLKERKIEKLPFFWFALAMLVYFVPTLPIFLSDVSVYYMNKETLLTLYNIKNALNILSKLCLSIAIFKW